LRAPGRHAVLDHEIDLARQELATKLGREVVGGAPPDQGREGFAVETGDDDLRPALVQREASADRFDHVVGAVAAQDQPVRTVSGDRAAHLEHLPQAPVSEQPDPVLTLGHERQPLLRRKLPLAAVADVRGDVLQRLEPGQVGDDPLAVVPDAEARPPALAHPRDPHTVRAGVQTVLHELRERLARIGLTVGEPADELERIVRPDLSADDILREAGCCSPRSPRLS
jgi:hypothetical protein